MKSPYVQGLKQGFAEISVYSFDFLLGSVRSFGLVGFEMLLWMFVIPADSQTALLERTAYFLFVNWVALIVGGARYNFSRELGEAIKQGTLSHYLLKPVSPVLYIYAQHIGGRFNDIFVGIIFIVLGTLWIPSFTLLTGALLILTLATALINTASLNLMSGALTFWTTEAKGIRNAFAQVTRLLNGQQIPLTLFMELLPSFWAKMIYILPFASVAYTPTHLIMAKSPGDIDYRFIIASLLWALVLPIFASLIWKRGLKHYESIGS